MGTIVWFEDEEVEGLGSGSLLGEEGMVFLFFGRGGGLFDFE